MDEQEKAPATEFGAEAPGFGSKANSSSEALSTDATASAEATKGKPVRVEQVPQMDNSVANARPSSIFDLVNQGNQGRPSDAAPMQVTDSTVSRKGAAQGPSGNWNSTNFLNPIPSLDQAIAASHQNNEQLAFSQLVNAQSAVDLITPENARIIVTDLENLKRQLPLETDAAKREQMQQRVAMGTRLLDSRWECPLRLAFGMIKLASVDGQPPAEAFRLLQEAAKVNPELKNNPDVKATLERYAGLYGNMGQAVKQSLEQAIAMGAETGGIQLLSAFQKDPKLAENLAKQGQKAQLDSTDPFVHARNAEHLMKSRGVLSQEARQEHSRSIELAKKVKNAKGESFNSLMADISKTKKVISEKEAVLAALKQQIEQAKKESKAVIAEAMAIENERAAEDKKSHSANMLEAGWTNLNRTFRSVTGEQEKLDNAHDAKVAEVVKKGNALRDLETQRKKLEAEIKSSQDSLKDKQAKLTEVGKPITEKHVGYAKALLQDADACTDRAAKAAAEQNKEEFDKSQALQMEDIVQAAQQLSRAEKISPQLANDEELKALKSKYSLVTTSIGEKIKDITPEQKQELDDRFLRAVNTYNQHRPDQLQDAMSKDGAKLTEFQAQMINELLSYKSYFPELEADAKLRAAMNLIGKGEPISEEALNQEATVESKSLKLGESAMTGSRAMQQFEALMAKNQFKDAEEALKIGLENLQPVYKSLKEKLAESEQAVASCTTLEQLGELRQQKQMQEMAVAACEEKVLSSIGSLYLTPEKQQVKQQDGSVAEVVGPGYKPEQAMKALNEARAGYPGIEKNPLFQKQMEMAQGLQKEIKQMEIKAAEDSEKLKEAGMDMTASLLSWGGAAIAGTVATGLIIGSAPVTVPAALAVLGITTLTGALVGGGSKVLMANYVVDAKDKDFGRNMSSGALVGSTSGLGGGGLKLGGMALAQTVKFGSVADKVSKFAPLEQSVGAILKGANGNVAKEVQLGEQILEAQLKQGKITEETFNLAKSWLSAKGVNGATTNTAEILQTVGVSMDELTLTAAGLKMEAAAGAGGARAIDAGWEALKAGLPQASNPVYPKWNVVGHAMNFGRNRINDVSNVGKLVSYATPYTAQRAFYAATPLAAASGTYNAVKYGSKVGSGEINKETGEQWTTGDAFNAALTNTAIDTSLSVGAIGALRLASGNPAVIADMKTMGLASATTWVANKLSRGGLNNMAAKMANAGPMTALKYDNVGIAAPFFRNVVPISAGSMNRAVFASGQSDKDSRILARAQSDLKNYEVEVAEAPRPETAEQAAQKQEIADAPQTEGTPEVVPQSNEVAKLENKNQPDSAANTDGPPQPIQES